MKFRVQQCFVAFIFLSVTFMGTISAAQDAAGIDPAVLAKANAGDAAAENLVAIEYQKGDVVPRDFEQAANWYRKAADQGYAPAQYSLGLLFQQKESGIMKDDAQAAAWLRKAADQGNAPAESALGLCFSLGRGVAKDEAQAAAWYQKAVAQNNTDAMVGLATLYNRGQGVAKDQKQALALDTKAAELGAADAEYQLGLAYDLGDGVKKDKNQAIDWYRKSAERGNTGAQFNLAQLLNSNHAEAYFWFSVAMDKLDGDPLLKATALRNEVAAKLKPAEKANEDERVSKWHPTLAAHP
jgi:uncharacterized protein